MNSCATAVKLQDPHVLKGALPINRLVGEETDKETDIWFAVCCDLVDVCANPEVIHLARRGYREWWDLWIKWQDHWEWGGVDLWCLCVCWSGRGWIRGQYYSFLKSQKTQHNWSFHQTYMELKIWTDWFFTHWCKWRIHDVICRESRIIHRSLLKPRETE